MYMINDIGTDIFNIPRDKIIHQFDKLSYIYSTQTINPYIKYNYKWLIKEIEFCKYAIDTIELKSPIKGGYDNQYFSYDVYWDNEFSVVNSFIFYINTLDDILKSNDTIMSQSVSELYKKINTYGFEKETESKSQAKPIYVSEFVPTKSVFVLDGNHRIYEAYNKKQKTISAVNVTEHEYFKALLNDNFRRLYLTYYKYQLFYRVLLAKSPLQYAKFKRKIQNINIKIDHL